MAEEIPKKTVMVLLALVIVVSILSTFVVLTAVGESREISQKTGYGTGINAGEVIQRGRTDSSGSVSLVIIKSNEE